MAPEASSRPRPGRALPPFANEPLTDFTRPEARSRMKAAIDDVRRDLEDGPYRCPIVIDGREVAGAESLDGPLPRATPRSSSARPRPPAAEQAARAVAAARRAFESWSSTPARDRAEVLLRAAEILRRDRFRAGGDRGLRVRQALARGRRRHRRGDRLLRVLRPRDDPPGRAPASRRPGRDQRHRADRPGGRRGHPPLELPAGDPDGDDRRRDRGGQRGDPQAGRAVAGHRPSRSYEAFREAGLPPGVLNFLPGKGEVVGQALVADPRVDLIAFTGSKAVGLEINRRAAETPTGQDHVKRVIAEMGGKNALIVDDDADLDEAVVGVLQSAFGYSGQKCSACSRVVVLDGVYDAFVARLAEAAQVDPGRPPRGPRDRRRPGDRRRRPGPDPELRRDRPDRRPGRLRRRRRPARRQGPLRRPR